MSLTIHTLKCVKVGGKMSIRTRLFVCLVGAGRKCSQLTNLIFSVQNLIFLLKMTFSITAVKSLANLLRVDEIFSLVGDYSIIAYLKSVKISVANIISFMLANLYFHGSSGTSSKKTTL